MRRFELLLAGLLLLPSLTVSAPMVQVVGLFPGAAVLNVDGQRKLVRVGQTGPGGVEVVSADSRGAVLRVGGVERSYGLSREYSGAGYAAPEKTQLSVAKGVGGHYWIAGSINSQPVQFLVDTGATSVAINENQARRLGIDYRAAGQPLLVNTASGTAKAWRVRLNSVKVGAIDVLGVEAVVLEGESPSEALLGMSFLGRVSWREDQGVLRLESKI
ncbi:retropepsin-like aspartic protease family protein [Stutzerimonas degradans]|uniref:TIGR02281 family clan AA aspartic protease n=1 Tax=Stutzerimonas degradans TaxID=2968968 RepID=A0A8E2QI34_9GAMM|nr:TIGR02281 family clan AA aspartic protease [Stutzerimonas degradans]MCQ4274776.1 TIGR02281 family clan AA aspartic protease [Stutzerimonas degradans]NHC09647.1 TIGR02281 family clan AA aspartic protease [Stutzerimonas degradans]NHW02111.1 TIGR02281 family clan AA aspartic protease [Stutzerimonas degradans]PNF78499.1 TIGR02281 family clan AA aspartic protease [Stutzerimonas degradans]QPT20359.1 TIGR02281 family clan AA aspartic protease [Stutzerimonas degradans]